MSFDADSISVARDFSLQGISILVVEDTYEFRHIISNYFSRCGATVFTAENGQMGLNLLNKHCVDVVMTGINMPVMDGLEMGTAIRKFDKETPIIFLSVDTGDLHLFTDGFTEILQCLKMKPALSALFDMLVANPNALLAELHTWLQARSSDRRLNNTLEKAMESQQRKLTQDDGQLAVGVNESGLIGNLSVLFAAHDGKAREYLSHFLEQQVGSLYTAVTGEDGLRLFERHRPQLVMASVAMSGMNGLEMAEQIRAICPNVQIILFNDVDSWSYQESKLLTLLKLAGNKFLAKPLSNDKLLEAIRFCLDHYDSVSDLHMSASVFMTVPMAITIANSERHIISANPAFTAITGYGLEEVKGISLYTSHPDQRNQGFINQ